MSETRRVNAMGSRETLIYEDRLDMMRLFHE